MGKRLLSILLIAALLFGLSGCNNAKPREEYKPIEVSERLLLKEGVTAPNNNSTGVPLGSEYLNIIAESGDYKYVVYEDAENSKVNIYVTSKEDLAELFEKADQEPTIKEVGKGTTFLKDKDILNQVESNALVVISNLTQNEGLLLNTPVVGETSYLTYNQLEWDNSAFGGIFRENMTVTEYMQSEDLRLLCDSPVVKKVIYNEQVGAYCWACAVVVEAEVFCVKNSGAFKGIKWIPKKGQSSVKDFVLTFWTYTDLTGEHAIAIGDIYVIGQDSSFVDRIKSHI